MFRHLFFFLPLLFLAGLLNGQSYDRWRRLDITTNGQQVGNIPSVTLSADGQFILFHGYGSSLAVDGGFLLHDIYTGTTQAVTSPFSASARPFSGSAAFGGRYVFSDHITAENQKRARLYDLQNETFERVGRGLNGAFLNADVTMGNMTPDGRYLTYFTPATNAFDGKQPPCFTTNCFHIFLWDRVTNKQKRLDLAPNGQPANNRSGIPVISDDGRYVLFISDATNLVSYNPLCDQYPCAHFYVRDRQTGLSERVNYAPNGDLLFDAVSWWSLFGYDLSGNGRYVVFTDVYDNGQGLTSRVLLRDTFTNTTEIINVNSNGYQFSEGMTVGANSISYDGRYVLFTANRQGDDALYLRDRKLKKTTLVNRDANGVVAPLEGETLASRTRASISRSGRYIVFSSNSDQVAGTTPGDYSRKLFLVSRPALVDHNLMKNGGFEKAKSPTHPNGWNTINLVKDRQMCNTTIIVAQTGECAFRFSADSGVTSKLVQVVQGPAGMPGETLDFSAWVKGKNLKGARIQAKIFYIGGANTLLRLDSTTLNNGTYDYTQLSATQTLTDMVKKIKVEIRMKNGTGKLWVDNVRLALTELPDIDAAAHGFIPLPMVR